MMHHPLKTQKTYPFWLKSTVILIGLCLLFAILSYGRFILMPIAFSAFLAMMVNPLVRRFESWKLGRVFSIVLTILIVLACMAGVISLISTQFVQFTERLPEIAGNLKKMIADIVLYLDETIGISEQEQSNYLSQGINNVIDRSGNYLSSIVNVTTNMFTNLFLIPIFVFFMLYYREMYQVFFRVIFRKKGNTDEVDDVLNRVQVVTQDYLVGVLTVMAILAFLNTVGLVIIGMEHALFFGVFAALMAIIPYIGIIIGSLPPLLFALLLTDSLLMPILVIGVFSIVQFLEGNFISPYIVGSKISINPFVAVIALIVGGELWGIAGMILFVPLIGILKVVFEQIPEMKPYGYLLGSHAEFHDDD